MRSQCTSADGIGRPVAGLLAVALLALCGGCGGTSTPDAGAPDSGEPLVGDCEITFRFRPPTSATTVMVMGEWNDFARTAHPMEGDDDGNYTATFQVPSGTWGYLFLANGAEYSDSGNLATVRRDGKTYSQLSACMEANSFFQRVRIPQADGDSELSVEGEVREPDGLAWPESTWRPLTGEELVIDKRSATVKLANLAQGKYTVRLRPSQNGVALDEVLLPFWNEEKAHDWRATPLYMLMIDRFRDGEPGNTPAPTPGVTDAASFKGGDLKGVEQAINDGYFEKLGIKAIWMTPWQTQPTKAYSDDSGKYQVLGYHGYWPVKAREVDPRFGGNAALASMVRAAHKKGIRIVMDTVLNHVSVEHEYFNDPAKKGWFRTGCNCGQGGCGWDDTPARYFCLFNAGMPDINWTVPEAKQQFIDDVVWWMDTFDIDGLRIDAAKHIEPEGIQAMSMRVRQRFEAAGTKVFMFGESYTGNLDFLKEYIGPDKLDSQLNFPIYFAVPETIFGRDDKGLQAAKGTIDWSSNTFNDYMVTFIGSHDDARFMTKADPGTRDLKGNKWSDLPGMPQDPRTYDRIYLALLNLVTTPGVPLLYYGDEYGEWGGSDPDNRHMMKAEGTLNDLQKSLLSRVRKLMTVRSQLRGLATGSLYQLWCNNESWGAADAGGGNLWAYARLDRDPKQSAVVVLSLRYESWTGVKVDFPASFGWASGTAIDALSGREYAITSGSVTIDVPGRAGVILKLK